LRRLQKALEGVAYQLLFSAPLRIRCLLDLYGRLHPAKELVLRKNAFQ
jgi:hypothetical protein